MPTTPPADSKSSTALDALAEALAHPVVYDPQLGCMVKAEAPVEPIEPPRRGVAFQVLGVDGRWHPLTDMSPRQKAGNAKSAESRQKNRAAWLAHAKKRKRQWRKAEPGLGKTAIIDRLLDEDEPWPKIVTKRPRRNALEKAKELWRD